MNQDELLALLHDRVKAEGGIEKFSEAHGVSKGYLANVMYCGAKPGPKIAMSLGLKKVVSFEPIK